MTLVADADVDITISVPLSESQPTEMTPRRAATWAIGQVLNLHSEVPQDQSIGLATANKIIELFVKKLGLKPDAKLSQQQKVILLNALGNWGFDISETTNAGQRTRAQLGINPDKQKPTKPTADREPTRDQGVDLAEPSERRAA